MNRTIVAAPIIAALALAGCGTTATSSSSPATSTAQAAPASQAGPGGYPVAQTARQGQPFTVTYDYAAGYGSASWKVTLVSITCGSGTIFDPKVLAADAASTGQPPPPTPQPDAGMKFCLVKFADTNESTSQQNWQANGESTVNVGMDAYRSVQVNGPGYDAQEAYMQEAQPASQTSDFGINPRVSAVSWAVFEVPAGAKVTSVSVEATAYSSGAQVVVITKTVTVPAPAKTVTMPAESSQPQPSASSAPQPSTSFQGDPTAGSGTGPACTTIAGYFPGGLPGHEDATGFCVPDKLGRARATSF